MSSSILPCKPNQALLGLGLVEEEPHSLPEVRRDMHRRAIDALAAQRAHLKWMRNPSLVQKLLGLAPMEIGLRVFGRHSQFY
jgi:hypothetical protein